jgi:hypothetical protein
MFTLWLGNSARFLVLLPLVQNPDPFLNIRSLVVMLSPSVTSGSMTPGKLVVRTMISNLDIISCLL